MFRFQLLLKGSFSRCLSAGNGLVLLCPGVSIVEPATLSAHLPHERILWMSVHLPLEVYKAGSGKQARILRVFLYT